MREEWWERPGLEIVDGRLLVAGRDAEALARTHGTPVFAFDLVRVREQALSLQAALEATGHPFKVRYALKAQREPAVLAALRALGAPGSAESVGIDVCSPGEVLHALEHGWRADEISYTGTNVSERDLDVLLEHGVHMNLDLLTQVHRYGRRNPGGGIGLRVNPRAGAKWGGEGETLYSAEKATKFGIYREQLPEALAIAAQHSLTIDTVHFHVGDGFLADGLPAFAKAVEEVAEFLRFLVDAGCPIAEVNAGGGLGVPQREGDVALDVGAYAQILADAFGPIAGPDVVLACEPGDFLLKESAVLLAEVVTVEERLGTWFAGLDAGFNVAPEHFIYGAPFEIVLAREADGPHTHRYTVSGNINEGDDLWGEDVPLPPVREGDILAILHVGTYSQSQQMWHCLRPPAAAVHFTDRA